jgi:predicted kinase
MTTTPLRCHLLIGAPGSGKTTFARLLAPLLRGPHGDPGLVLSTDAIREELFGDAGIQGPWDEIRTVLLTRLQKAVEAGIPVIIDATHARRPWRLLYTQALQLPQPVEWIGWWLTTPLQTCLEWAQQRQRPVPEAVIREFHSAIGHKKFGPSRDEGFATVVTLNPAAGEASLDALQGPTSPLLGLDRRISAGVNRNQAKLPYLHRYSRLLDLERLLFLLRLLTSFNGLDDTDPGTASALEQILNPAPVGDLADRAAAYLVSWKEVHGGNAECYGDAASIRADLAWLEANGFFHLDWQSEQPIEPGEARPQSGSSRNGGYAYLGDSRAFRRVFTLLRHILRQPFDAPPALEPEGKASSPRGERNLHSHLIQQLSHLEGSYASGQESVLRKDFEELLLPYGFRRETRGRPESVRHGYAIGTALLSVEELLDVHNLLKASLERLSDASQKPVLQALEERLRWAGLLDYQLPRTRHPKRAFANRALTEAPNGTLAQPETNQRLERAIVDRRRIRLRHLPDPEPTQEMRQRGDDGSFVVWPLQMLFHNISWYLAFERYGIGTSQGLIQTLRLDRLVMLGEDGNARRNSPHEHTAALQRLERLLHLCGGLYFGNSLEAQLAITASLPDSAAANHPAQIAGLEWYDRLRFSCTPAIFRLIREEPKRFPPEHTRYSKPIAGLSDWEPGPLDQLQPNAPGDSHLYPVEIMLPRWTVHEDWDLRGWLFRFGAGIRIEEPSALRQTHLQMAQDVVDLYTRAPQS